MGEGPTQAIRGFAPKGGPEGRRPESSKRGYRGQAESWGRQHGQVADRRRGKGATKLDLSERGEARRDEDREAGDSWVEGCSKPNLNGIGLSSQQADHEHLGPHDGLKLNWKRES